MLRDEYASAAEEFKEEIISTFLRQNPGVSRSEVSIKYVNGRMICEHISNTFKELSIKKPAQSPAEKKLLKDLAKGGDERFTCSLESIASSRTFVNWLSMSPNTGFTEKDKTENASFLERKEQQSSTCALDLNEAKKKMALSMKDSKVKPTESLTKTLVGEYFHCFLSQLKCQHSVYTKEVELGDRFSFFAQRYIKEAFGQVKMKAKNTTLNAIKKAYAVLKGSQIDITDVSSKGQIDKIDEALREFGEQLEKRRKELDTINKMIGFLDDITKTLTGEGAASKEEKPKGPSGPRMAFQNKSRGRR